MVSFLAVPLVEKSLAAVIMSAVTFAIQAPVVSAI